MVVVDRLIDIGQGLRLDPLRRIDHQDRALTRGQAARHLIGEVDVSRRVHQVQDILQPVLGLVVQAHGLRLDGDPALLLDVHIIKDLFRHFPRGQPAGVLDQPVRQRGLAVVDMGDHREITDAFDRGRRHGLARLASAGRERYGNGDQRVPRGLRRGKGG
ncbi:hypothetical protein D3C85_512420 [compost metagenome]